MKTNRGEIGWFARETRNSVEKLSDLLNDDRRENERNHHRASHSLQMFDWSFTRHRSTRDDKEKEKRQTTNHMDHTFLSSNQRTSNSGYFPHYLLIIEMCQRDFQWYHFGQSDLNRDVEGDDSSLVFIPRCKRQCFCVAHSTVRTSLLSHRLINWCSILLRNVEWIDCLSSPRDWFRSIDWNVAVRKVLLSIDDRWICPSICSVVTRATIADAKEKIFKICFGVTEKKERRDFIDPLNESLSIRRSLFISCTWHWNPPISILLLLSLSWLFFIVDKTKREAVCRFSTPIEQNELENSRKDRSDDQVDTVSSDREKTSDEKQPREDRRSVSLSSASRRVTIIQRWSIKTNARKVEGWDVNEGRREHQYQRMKTDWREFQWFARWIDNWIEDLKYRFQGSNDEWSRRTDEHESSRSNGETDSVQQQHFSMKNVNDDSSIKGNHGAGVPRNTRRSKKRRTVSTRSVMVITSWWNSMEWGDVRLILHSCSIVTACSAFSLSFPFHDHRLLSILQVDELCQPCVTLEDMSSLSIRFRRSSLVDSIWTLNRILRMARGNVHQPESSREKWRTKSPSPLSGRKNIDRERERERERERKNWLDESRDQSYFGDFGSPREKRTLQCLWTFSRRTNWFPFVSV